MTSDADKRLAEAAVDRMVEVFRKHEAEKHGGNFMMCPRCGDAPRKDFGKSLKYVKDKSQEGKPAK